MSRYMGECCCNNTVCTRLNSGCLKIIENLWRYCISNKWVLSSFKWWLWKERPYRLDCCCSQVLSRTDLRGTSVQPVAVPYIKTKVTKWFWFWTLECCKYQGLFLAFMFIWMDLCYSPSKIYYKSTYYFIAFSTSVKEPHGRGVSACSGWVVLYWCTVCAINHKAVATSGECKIEQVAQVRTEVRVINEQIYHWVTKTRETLNLLNWVPHGIAYFWQIK